MSDLWHKSMIRPASSESLLGDSRAAGGEPKRLHQKWKTWSGTGPDRATRCRKRSEEIWWVIALKIYNILGESTCFHFLKQYIEIFVGWPLILVSWNASNIKSNFRASFPFIKTVHLAWRVNECQKELLLTLLTPFCRLTADIWDMLFWSSNCEDLI